MHIIFSMHINVPCYYPWCLLVIQQWVAGCLVLGMTACAVHRVLATPAKLTLLGIGCLSAMLCLLLPPISRYVYNIHIMLFYNIYTDIFFLFVIILLYVT